MKALDGYQKLNGAHRSYVSKNANDISRMYSLKALELLVNNIRTVYHEPGNMKAREKMLLGSYFAGCAISVGTCLAHYVGQPVGGIYKIPHGDSCTIFLTPSMKLNMDAVTKEYADIAKVLGVDTAGMTDLEAANAGIHVLEDIEAEIGAPTKLSQYISREDFDMEAVLDNIQASMGHLKNNPKDIDREMCREILEMVW